MTYVIFALFLTYVLGTEMYKKWNPKKNIDIEPIKKRFLDKGYVYIDESLSSYNFTTTSFASMLNMQPLFKHGLTRFDKIYKDQLFPQSVSMKNFENNKHPNLIYNLYKIDYKFIWLGSPVGCDIYNPKLCIDYNQPDNIKNLKKIKINVPEVNWYILDIFLVNTPVTQIYNKISDILFKEKNINFISKNNNKFDFTNEFLENFHQNKETYSKQNYFYFIHQLFPKWSYVFNDDCSDGFIKNNNGIKEYMNNYRCTLKTIDKLIIFLEKKDPNAVVIFQADHGVNYNEKKDKFKHERETKSKIFNLIKVPNYCKNELNNNIDNINSVRLALSCATNTKPKLLERKKLEPL